MSKKYTILFVDDDISVLDALRRALRSQHDIWNMHIAQSVDEALEKANEISFDAIVTDVTMPERDGFDLLAALQDTDLTSDIPVIILTGLDEVDLKRRALEMGAVDLLNKPIITEDLIARLQSVLLGVEASSNCRREEIATRQSSLENPFPKQTAMITLTHHKQWCGRGYPNGLQGEQIPIEARIVAAADVYDALSHARPYKPAYSEDEVLAMMTKEAPWHFDPEVFAAFRRIRDEFHTIQHDLSDVVQAAE